MEQANSVLDIGCGCGVITFCMAQRLARQKHSSLLGIDIDNLSIQEAQENRKNYPVYENQYINFENISLQDFTKTTTRKFDLIVTNPPFYGNSLKSPDVKKNISMHRDGNLPFEILALCAAQLLEKEGVFWLILPCAEMEVFYKTAQQTADLYPFSHFEIFPVRDKKNNRIVAGFTQIRKLTYTKKDIYIRERDGSYSKEYLELIHPFLLL